MTRMSSTGSPADLKVNSSTEMTNTIDSTLISRLSFSNEVRRSLQLVVSPTT